MSGAREGRGWKRLALALVMVSVVLAGVLIWERAGTGAEEEVLGAFIDTYFRTWSERDMAGYERCFHPRAVIHFIDGQGVPQASMLGPFIEMQRQAHAAAPMREIPLEKEIEVDGNVARALVRWKLFKEEGDEVGTDYFTLVKSKTGWRILGLVFRKDG